MEQTTQTTRGLSLFALKLIAMVSMVCDHVGALFFPGQIGWTMVGRLAFPVYCYLIVNGLLHTRSKSGYLGRMIGFAVLSQVPFTLMLLTEQGVALRYLLLKPTLIFTRLNSLFVLSFGLCAVWLLDALRQRYGKGGHLAGLLCAAGLAVLSWLCQCEYCFLGVPLIVAFYEAWLLKETFHLKTLPAALVQILLGSGALALYLLLRVTVQGLPLLHSLYLCLCQLAAVLLLACYNGALGCRSRSVKYIFYVFYPAHLAVLVLLRAILP